MDGGSMTGTGETVTVLIGAEGGTIELSDATLTVPAGALSTPTSITVTETTMPTPAGYRAFSPLYRFEPEGLTFERPVTVSIRSRASAADLPLGALFWSRASGDGSGWDRRGGVPTGSDVVGTVEHFSFGFVADGVDYTEVPDRSCVRTRVLDTRTLPPAGLGVFFVMEDCEGRPLADVSPTELRVLEDDALLSSEAMPSLIELRGLHLFVTLAIDMSFSTRDVLDEVVAGASAFIDTLAEPARGLEGRVSVGIIAFAGEAAATVWQSHSPDLASVRARLQDISLFTPTDSASTNLNGALVEALALSQSAQEAFEARNMGGAFTGGYVVLFTDGSDTAGSTSLVDAVSALQASTDEALAVAYAGADYDAGYLRRLLGDRAVLDTPSPSTLARDFANVAARMAGQVRRTYLLGYCSPKRAGAHTVSIGLAGAEQRRWSTDIAGTASFDATGFAPGCSSEMFRATTLCGSATCGGFGCGACNDLEESCNGTTCENPCVVSNECGGTMFTTAGGFSVVCRDVPERTLCAGECTNLASDPLHCGGCGNACFCTAGMCSEVTRLWGRWHQVCVQLASGGFRCWGSANGYGELGDGTTEQRTTPVTGPTDPSIVELAIGVTHTCGRRSDGSVWCWGDNAHGKLGDGTTAGRVAPAPVMDVSNAIQVDAGPDHSCALISDGTVRCWGYNGMGGLGDGTTTTRLLPVTVSGLTNAVEIAVGNLRTCARLSDGTVRCWGSNTSYGALGDGTTMNRSTPTAVIGISTAVEIDLGEFHGCALLADGSARCWGANNGGSLGNGTTASSTTPVTVSGVTSATALAVGRGHACVILGDESLRCWGNNTQGELGNGTAEPTTVPTVVVGLAGVRDVVAGVGHTCALLSGGEVYCWGYLNSQGLGNGVPGGSRSPIPVP